MIELCIFDMDGLLLDSERQLYSRAGLEVSAGLGRPVDQAFLTTLMGMSWDRYRTSFLEYQGADYPIDEYLDRLWKRIHEIMDNEAIPLRPHVREFLDECRRMKMKMAVATSTYRNNTEQCLGKALIRDYFDHIVCGDEVKKGKPDPEIFLKTVDHYGIAKDRVLVFEDGHNGARAAISGGLRLVIVEDLAYLSAEDKEEAELVITDIMEALPLIKRENEGTAGIQA